MAESTRSFWKGHLRLALVSIPVRLVSAEKAEAEIRFHQVDRESRQRIRYLKVAPGKGEVKKEDIVLGYEVEPGNHVFMDDEELDSLGLPSRHTIEPSHFGCTMDGQMRQARFLGAREDMPAKRADAAAPKLSRVTHADRVVFPADGITKGEIAAYYDAVAPRMAPHLLDRPVSLLRAPETIDDLFFQRHPLKGMTRGVVKVQNGEEPYIALDGALGLQTAAQFGAIEIHGWMSLSHDLDHPDRLVFDLDPDADLPFGEVTKAASELRAHLGAIGLKSWPMITGGKGAHVVAPLDRSLSYTDTEIFAAGFARGLARQEPKRFVAVMSKRRREGRIFIDWLRNKKSATAILPWSLRARPGAPVATPLSWEKLKTIDSARAFDLHTALKVGDDWRGFFETSQTIAPGALAFMRANER